MARRTKPLRPNTAVRPRKPNATALAALRERARDNNPIWEALTKLAAPAAIVVSATCYLSGFTYKYFLLRNFGFRPGLIDSSVQDNIAFGYIPFALIVLAFLAVFIGLWVMQKAANEFGKYRSANLTWEIRVKISRPFSSLNLATLTLAALSMGAVSGIGTAEYSTYRIAKALDGGCKTSCYRYNLSTGQMTGVMVAQSKDVTILAGRNSTYVVPTSTIRNSRPARPRPYGWFEL